MPGSHYIEYFSNIRGAWFGQADNINPFDFAPIFALLHQVGTAALLNVPASLEKVLKEMRAQGYDLGEAGSNIDGEAVVAALKVSLANVRRGGSWALA